LKKSLAVLMVLLMMSVVVGLVFSCGGGGEEDPDIDLDGYVSSVDCDDSASSCTDDCVSDVDGDRIPDCVDLCLDTDGDGYGVDNSLAVVGSGSDDVGSCTEDGSTPCTAGGTACLGLDCDDDPATGSSINPGEAEICSDGIDNDCDKLVDCYDETACGADEACSACLDGDMDGYFANDGLCSGGDDCDDANADINPGGTGEFGCPRPLCSTCAIDEDCGTGNRCVPMDNAQVCVTDCSSDGICPAGYECTPDGMGNSYCMPISQSCACLPENDGDERECFSSNSFGTCGGTEVCDPSTGWIGCDAPAPAEELCDGIDNDCDGVVDDDPLPDPCANQQGVCAGSVSLTCGGASGWLACDDVVYSSYSPDYENPEETCDGLDNDCDGQTDEGVLITFYRDYDGDGFGDSSITLQACAEPVGYAADPGDCDNSDPEVYPGAAEVCDGLDNNCSGQVDEGFAVGGECTVGIGECGRSGTMVCLDDGMGPRCDALPGEPSEEVCDGIDNDCDGVVDDDPLPDPCANQQGICAGSLSLTCGGDLGWLACDDATFSAYSPAYENPEEACDSLDNDCDGQTDEGLIGPLCTNQNGVCQGSRKSCGGTSGWLECSSSDYSTWAMTQGFTYESMETLCDGLDNDCDGSVDEGCPL